MSERRNRQSLKPEFADGERPSGDDFAELIDSCLNFEDDKLDVDAAGNLILSQGLALGNSNRQTAGTLRFNSGTNRVQYHNGTSFVDLSGGGAGAFQPPGTPGGASGPVTYGGGTVGIGTFSNPPTFQLEVNLAANTGEGQRVRFGNVVCSNGQGGTDAFFYNRNLTNPATQFALQQRDSGEVLINAPANQRIRFTQDNGVTPRLAITQSGNVVVGAADNIQSPSSTVFQVSGEVFKTGTKDTWTLASDVRLKEDVRDLEAGLAELLQVRPVRFRFNA